MLVRLKKVTAADLKTLLLTAWKMKATDKMIRDFGK